MNRLVPAIIVLSSLPVAALIGTGIGFFLDQTSRIEVARHLAIVVVAAVFGLTAMGARLNRRGRRR